MSTPLTLYDLDPEIVMKDVYFNSDFLSMHMNNKQDSISQSNFSHTSNIISIPDTAQTDMETPWGYGGPVATSHTALSSGLTDWHKRQRESGRVAEFIRLHPFLNPMALKTHFNFLAFNRATVIVDLIQKNVTRWKFYTDSTRNCIRKAEKKLNLRLLLPNEWPLCKKLYELGLTRNKASENYFFSDKYFQDLLSQRWCKTWVAEDTEGPLAMACFLKADNCPLVHYHLSGGDDRSRRTNAIYLLLENAFQYFTEIGCRWVYLGGGRSIATQDTLLKFKSKFSNVLVPFYTGGIIFDKTAYTNLGGGGEQFLCSGPISSSSAVHLKNNETAISYSKVNWKKDFSMYFRIHCDPGNITWSNEEKPPTCNALMNKYKQESDTEQKCLFWVRYNNETVGYLSASKQRGQIETECWFSEKVINHNLSFKVLTELIDKLKGLPEWPPPYCTWLEPGEKLYNVTHEAVGFKLNKSNLPKTHNNLVKYPWVYGAETG